MNMFSNRTHDYHIEDVIYKHKTIAILLINEILVTKYKINVAFILTTSLRKIIYLKSYDKDQHTVFE